MAVWSRIFNLFRTRKLHAEIEEELNAHLQNALEDGRDAEEVRRSFGSLLRHSEQSRDIRIFGVLDHLRADLIFGWHQIVKRPATSLAAILSLALAIGSCTAVFRIFDALLLRPLPVRDADRLFAMVLNGVGPDGSVRNSEWSEYPQFLQMRDAARNDAELIGVSGVELVDLTYKGDPEMERAHRQFVSGWMFDSFGLKPALGRLLASSDDVTPKASPYAVLSYDYWSRRFGRDRSVIGQKFRLGNELYEIVGVTASGFTGTETGTFTDFFVPNSMYEGVTHNDWASTRVLVQIKPDGNKERVRQQMQAVWTAVQTERAKGFLNWPLERRQKYLQQKLILQPAGGGLSEMQHTYRTAILAIAILVGLVLLVASMNLANLLSAQAAARSREMALRVSIGAGRARLMQLVLMESALLAAIATCLGALFAWWAAPLLVQRINPPDDPARLSLPADWRVFLFLTVLTAGTTVLCGLLPALRASSVRPAAVLKGGENPHSRRRLLYVLIALQVAFCFIVHFTAGGFVSTVRHLSNQSTGFTAERLLALDTVAKHPQPASAWRQAAEHLRQLTGVESVAIADVPLLGGEVSNGFVSVNGQPPSPVLGYFLGVSPGWLQTMQIRLLRGRDLSWHDAELATALVNAAFAKEYFSGQDPVGRSFAKGQQIYRVVGLVSNAVYRSIREPEMPTAYPLFGGSGSGVLERGTLLVRTREQNPYRLAQSLRRAIPDVEPELRVSDVRTQVEIDQSQTVRERLLAALAVFFAATALLLAGVGLYGVLDYSVIERRRELGIRIAIGATGSEIALQVTIGILSAVLTGSLFGGAISLGLESYLQSLLYQVKASDPRLLSAPLLTILSVFLLTAIPAVIRGMRINPVEVLHAD